MAAERRLKGEIDRTLKKVQEGQEVFEDLWQQVHECDNSNQREKLEDQLKKEIKKLQRLREQIKGWIANADIKDKQPLLDARKSIEKDMERFKACEREMKMAGRAGMPKPADPKEKAKDDARDWINNAVESLQGKIDAMEYELEELQGNLKKKAKPPPRVAELEEVTTRHKDHINRLEKVLRCIDNETIQPDEMENLRSEMDMYLNDEEDSGMDYSQVAVDDMYEDLLDRLEAVDLAAPAAVAAHAHGKLAKGIKDKEELEKERERERENEKQRAAAQAAKAQLVAQGNHNIKLDEDDANKAKQAALAAAPAAPTPAAGTAAAAVNAMAPAVKVTAIVPPIVPPLPSPLAGQPPPPPPPGSARGAAPDKPELPAERAASLQAPVAANGTAQQPVITPRGAAHQEPAAQMNATTPAGRGPAPGFAAAGAQPQGLQTPPPQQQRAGAAAAGPPPGIAQPANAGGAWADTAAAQNLGVKPVVAKAQPGQAAVQAPGQAIQPPPGITRQPSGVPPPGYTPTKAGSLGADGTTIDGTGVQQHRSGAWSDAGQAGDALKNLTIDGPTEVGLLRGVMPASTLPPLEPPNFAPVAPAYSNAAAKQILDGCYTRAHPQPHDTDTRTYRPRHPYLSPNPALQIPASYPRVPHEVSENPSLFRKVDPEVLFYAFYFQPQTYQQFMAAHELKRQSWRFHKHHNAWFQRFTEPSITSDEFEQGAYVYFDYNIMHDDNQTGWCYRRKENFTFRYDALEDELKGQPIVTGLGAGIATGQPGGF